MSERTPKPSRRPRGLPGQQPPAPAGTAAAEPEPEPAPEPEPEPAAPTGRQLLDRARSLGREADLYYHAHLGRWPHRPSLWTAEQRRSMSSFLDGFLRPDGMPQPVLHRARRGRG
jgi:hypothetical protein